MSNFNAPDAQHIAVCLVLRGLLDRLIERDVIGPSDILAIRNFAIDFDADIGVTIPAGQPDLYPAIKEKVLTLWESLGIPRTVPENARYPLHINGVAG